MALQRLMDVGIQSPLLCQQAVIRHLHCQAVCQQMETLGDGALVDDLAIDFDRLAHEQVDVLLPEAQRRRRQAALQNLCVAETEAHGNLEN